MKKLLLRLHRMLGSILSLAFVVWFISGFVMLFSGFPHASGEKQFENQNAFTRNDQISDIKRELTCKINELTLEKINHTPIYRITYNDKSKKLIDAQTLSEIESINAEELDKLVTHNYKAGILKKTILSDFDSWIPWSHFDKYFPIHKYHLDDSKHSSIYVSEKTGTIVQETNRKQRWMARFGAIPHWYYFKSLRLKRELWIKVVVWVSAIGSIMCFIGIILGFIRFKKPKKSELLSFSPYKKKWYKWHHKVGFIFGLFTFTFVFSGMMSLLSVPSFIVPVTNEVNYQKNWSRKQHELNDFKLPVSELFRDKRLGSIKRIDWYLSMDDFPCYFVYSTDLHHPFIINAGQADTVLISDFTLHDIERMLKLKNKRIRFTSQLLTSSDGYYTESNRHPLPIMKFTISDTDKTWLYINPDNLEMVQTLNKNTRVRRWLYKGLHSFDFKFLENKNGLRITILILLSIVGTVISTSGLVLSYKYLKRKIKKYSR